MRLNTQQIPKAMRSSARIYSVGHKVGHKGKIALRFLKNYCGFISASQTTRVSLIDLNFGANKKQ